MDSVLFFEFTVDLLFYPSRLSLLLRAFSESAHDAAPVTGESGERAFPALAPEQRIAYTLESRPRA